MNSPQPAPDLAAVNSDAQGRNWARRLVNVLVALVVVAVAGATFVFSYDGVHAIALLGGVSDQLARYYPGLFDAVLVIACLAAVMLRDGKWWARLWAWLVIVILLAAIGTTDVLHAMNYSLRHRVTEGVVAAAPVVAVLLAFSLLLALLRQSRTQAPAAPAAPLLDLPALPAAVPPPIALPAAPTVSMAPPLAAPPPLAAATRAEPQDAPAEPTATVPLPTAAVTVAPLTEPVPADEDVPVADVAPTKPAPVLAGRADTAPEGAHAATEQNEVILAAVTAEAPAAAEEPPPAPPTVEVPAVVLSRKPVRPQSIRYADDVRDTTPSADYWDSEDTVEFAGLVFSAPDNDNDDEAESDEPAPKSPPELDDDAPPFAAAPFAPVARLNRVRSTPTPPADEDE